MAESRAVRFQCRFRFRFRFLFRFRFFGLGSGLGLGAECGAVGSGLEFTSEGFGYK